jgi:phosphoglucomutase
MKVTKQQYEQAIKECAMAGVDPDLTWSQLSPQAQAVLIKNVDILQEYIEELQDQQAFSE